MDISMLSLNTALAGAQSDIGLLVLGKALDMSEVTGNAMVEMIDSAAIELSVTPHLGNSIDISV